MVYGDFMLGLRAYDMVGSALIICVEKTMNFVQ